MAQYVAVIRDGVKVEIRRTNPEPLDLQPLLDRAAGMYTHVQTLESLVWLVQHNLGGKPAGIVCRTYWGEEVEGIVEHINDRVLTITFLPDPDTGLGYKGTAEIS